VLKALREAGNSVLSELHGVDEATLRERPADGDWSLKEIAAHLRDAEALALRQLTAIAEGSRRPLPISDIDSLPAVRDYNAHDLSRLLTEFRELRGQTTGLLWGLSAGEWQRAGKHPYRGEVTAEQVARELAQHDLEHLWQVRRLKFELDAAVHTSLDDDW
jgi:hypothetical protein